MAQGRQDIADGIVQRLFSAVLGQFLREVWPDYLNRADVAPGVAQGRWDDVLGEWIKEILPGFWFRADIAKGWAAGLFNDVYGELLKENGAVVVSPPPPPPSPPPPGGRCTSYIAGECTAGACALESWVPEGLGNANQWCDRAAGRGFRLTNVPTLHAIACFMAGGLYDPTFGHLGVVIDPGRLTRRDPDRYRFEVREMNFSGFNRYDDRWATSDAVQAFILPPGVEPGPAEPPPVPAPAGSLSGLQQAWGGAQDFWNTRIEAEIAELQRLAGLIGAQRER